MDSIFSKPAALSQNAPKKVIRRPDRVTLTISSLSKVDGWIGQLNALLQGSRLTRNDFINWLINREPEKLSEADLKQLKEKYFDPIKALEWAARKAKEAKAKGENVNLKEFIASNFFVKPKIPRTDAGKPDNQKTDTAAKLSDKKQAPSGDEKKISPPLEER